MFETFIFVGSHIISFRVLHLFTNLAETLEGTQCLTICLRFELYFFLKDYLSGQVYALLDRMF